MRFVVTQLLTSVETDEMVLTSDESTLNSCEGIRGINSFAMPGTSLTNELERTTEGGDWFSSSPSFFFSSLSLESDNDDDDEELDEELDEDDFFDLLPLLLCLEEEDFAATPCEAAECALCLADWRLAAE